MPRVLSVGQCGFDSVAIGRQLQKTFRAEVVGASTFPEALRVLSAQAFDLVLVNRVTDSDGTLGLDFIRTLKSSPDHDRLAVMLVSNYRDAQEQAEALGALPGFGKSELASEQAESRLRAVFSVGTAEKTEPR